jgi:hypothetical protein
MHEDSKQDVIRAGALAVLRILATMPFIGIREECSRVLITLSQDADTFPFILREQIVPVLVLFVHSTTDVVLETAVKALSVLSYHREFSEVVIKIGTVSALVHAALSCRLKSRSVIASCTRCLFYLSFEHSKVCDTDLLWND